MLVAYELPQGFHIFDRKYGECLSNLWQIFGKNDFESNNIFDNFRFSSQNGNCLEIYADFIVFCNLYFSILSNLLRLTIKTRCFMGIKMRAE